jgi:hypothetical protein
MTAAPHAQNHLPRWQKRLLDRTLLLLALSGGIWLAVHYSIGGGRADSLPHPSEPWLMRVHGLAAFVALFVLGSVSALHVPRGWRRGLHRRSGVIVLAGWGLAVASAWLLYYLSSEALHPWVSWFHVAGTTGLWLAIALHRRPAP